MLGVVIFVAKAEDPRGFDSLRTVSYIGETMLNKLKHIALFAAFMLCWLASIAIGGTWDGNFERVATLVTDGGSPAWLVVKNTYNNAQIGPYIVVECNQDTFVGNGRADAGTSICVGDGGVMGNPCRRINYSIGEKYYSQLALDQQAVAVMPVLDGGSAICNVFRQRN